MKIRALVILGLICSTFISAKQYSLIPSFHHSIIVSPAEKLTWDMLKDVSFKKKWYPQESIFMLYPTFGAPLKKLENKEVIIRGYVIPVDVSTNMYVLSAFPYSQCFFCGGAGPESVMSLKPLKSEVRKYKTDDMHTFKGKLKLNADDIYEMNYILEEADMIE
ncbi:MAG: hypothetical protein RLZZ306_2695 [Bacteroidota bacterium]|jgi:hypothetical protein